MVELFLYERESLDSPARLVVHHYILPKNLMACSRFRVSCNHRLHRLKYSDSPLAERELLKIYPAINTRFRCNLIRSELFRSLLYQRGRARKGLYVIAFSVT